MHSQSLEGGIGREWCNLFEIAYGVLPDTCYAVSIKLRVDTNEGNLFIQRLCNQQSIERIFVMKRQSDEHS